MNECPLTLRQLRVIMQMFAGSLNHHEIALECRLTRNQVKRALRTIYQKAGIHGADKGKGMRLLASARKAGEMRGGMNSYEIQDVLFLGLLRLIQSKHEKPAEEAVIAP